MQRQHLFVGNQIASSAANCCLQTLLLTAGWHLEFYYYWVVRVRKRYTKKLQFLLDSMKLRWNGEVCIQVNKLESLKLIETWREEIE
jgi:hypothetical protein